MSPTARSETGYSAHGIALWWTWIDGQGGRRTLLQGPPGGVQAGGDTPTRQIRARALRRPGRNGAVSRTSDLLGATQHRHRIA